MLSCSESGHHFSPAFHVFHGNPMAVSSAVRPALLGNDYAVAAASLGFAVLLMAGMYVGTGVIEDRANAAKGTLVIAGSFTSVSQGDYATFSGQRYAPQRLAAR